MAAEKKTRLGDLQLQIMKVLWASGSATVAEVHKNVESKGELAYTTIATMLRKMEARGLVRHREEGRKFIYEPAVSERGVVTSMADDILDRLFEGSLSDMVNHLLNSRKVSHAELIELEKLIAQRRRKS